MSLTIDHAIKNQLKTLLSTFPRLNRGWGYAETGAFEDKPGSRNDLPAYISLDSQALLSNADLLRQQAKRFFSKQSEVCYLVKSNAYGHGPYVPLMLSLKDAKENRSSLLVVARQREAIGLRSYLAEVGLEPPILCLLSLFPDEAASAVTNNLISMITNLEALTALNRAAEAQEKTASIFIKFNSGMNRQGLSFDAFLKVYEAAMAMPNIHIVGMMSHLASAEDMNDSTLRAVTHAQVRLCYDLLCALERLCQEKGKTFPRYISVFNSAGLSNLSEIFKGDIKQADFQALLSRHPETRMLFKPGINLYGLPHDGNPASLLAGLKPVLSLYARVSAVETLAKGQGVSYGDPVYYAASKETRRALIQAGYGDGFLRAPEFPGQAQRQLVASVHNQSVPIIGRVCMDQCSLDIGDLSDALAVGDMVTLIGGEGPTAASEVAKRYGSTAYEVVTRLSAVLPRVIYC